METGVRGQSWKAESAQAGVRVRKVAQRSFSNLRGSGSGLVAPGGLEGSAVDIDTNYTHGAAVDNGAACCGTESGGQVVPFPAPSTPSSPPSPSSRRLRSG